MATELINQLAYDGKIEALQKELMVDPKKATMKFQDERQPLHWACSGGHDVIVDYLLSVCNVPVDDADDIAEMLISCNCDVNVADDTTNATPLHRAASRGNLKIVRLLTENSCKLDSVDIEGNTALHLACEEERTEVAELLHQSGASLTVLNKEKKSPLDLSPPYLKRRLTGD